MNLYESVTDYTGTAASIWLEVWGVVDPVTGIFDFIRKKSDFPQKFPLFQAKKSDDLFLVIN